MKKRFGSYTIGWAVLLALFNVIAFVSPGWIWFEKYDAAFWIGYAFITATFFGQLICARFALKEENSTRLFYKVSLITTSYTGLIVTFVIGGLCMLISPLPYWIGILICSIVLAANILAVIKAAAVVDEVQKIDDKVKTQTEFIKTLAADAQLLIAKAQSEAVKAECKKVYEAIRYSDPMSNEKLAILENEIAKMLAMFANAIAADDSGKAADIAKELLVLVDSRNQKCRLFK